MTTPKRGRLKGSLNKVTNEAKQAILMAFDRLGGVDRLVGWVEANPANEVLFWTKVFTKLLPRPATDLAPAPEAAPAVRGALTWRTPDWAKQVPRQGSGQAPGQGSGQARRTRSGKAALRGGVAEAAAAVGAAAATAVEDVMSPATGPPDGPPTSGWVAEVGR